MSRFSPLSSCKLKCRGLTELMLLPGVSGNGSKLVMWDAQRRKLSLKDLGNFDRVPA